MEHKIVIPISEGDVQSLFDLVHNDGHQFVWRFTANTGEEIVVKFIKDEE